MAEDPADDTTGIPEPVLAGPLAEFDGPAEPDADDAMIGLFAVPEDAKDGMEDPGEPVLVAPLPVATPAVAYENGKTVVDLEEDAAAGELGAPVEAEADPDTDALTSGG